MSSKVLVSLWHLKPCRTPGGDNFLKMGVSGFLSCFRKEFDQERKTVQVEVYLVKQSKHSNERLEWVAQGEGADQLVLCCRF